MGTHFLSQPVAAVASSEVRWHLWTRGIADPLRLEMGDIQDAAVLVKSSVTMPVVVESEDVTNRVSYGIPRVSRVLEMGGEKKKR